VNPGIFQRLANRFLVSFGFFAFLARLFFCVFGCGGAVGDGGPSVRRPMLLFEFAFAPALVFVSVLLQAANAMLNNTITDNKQAFLLIFNVSFQRSEARAPAVRLSQNG